MRKIWVKIDPWDKNLATCAIESGADGIMVEKGFANKVKELGKIKIIADDGDLILGKDVVFYKITSSSDEAEIIKLCQNKKVILQSDDWTIIPLENLIAQKADIIAQVNSYKDAQTAFEILEKGVNHILFSASNLNELKKTLNFVKNQHEKVNLIEAKIIDVVSLGMGDRVCVDTCTSMESGQGMLVGNSSNAFFLVHSESVENPYVAPRPFRVNAGTVHSYIKVPNEKTKYLSELVSGDEVQIVNFKGESLIGIVGRVKIEKRPLLLVKALINNNEISTILQNAETIRLTKPDGKPISVVNLKKDDKILVAIQDGARHFGHKIDETITEK